jgi:hypothetical protein
VQAAVWTVREGALAFGAVESGCQCRGDCVEWVRVGDFLLADAVAGYEGECEFLLFFFLSL